MSKLRCHISISADGFVAGPNQSEEDPLGKGGERLHDWVVSLAAWRELHDKQGGEVNESTRIMEETVEMEGGTTFHFVTDGIERALERAKESADGQDVRLWGGAQVINQYLAAGLLDELELHIAPVLLGEGARLFDNLGGAEIELEQVRAVEAPGVTHLKYKVMT